MICSDLTGWFALAACGALEALAALGGALAALAENTPDATNAPDAAVGAGARHQAASRVQGPVVGGAAVGGRPVEGEAPARIDAILARLTREALDTYGCDPARSPWYRSDPAA